jgi:HEAT repeat protein
MNATPMHNHKVEISDEFCALFELLGDEDWQVRRSAAEGLTSLIRSKESCQTDLALGELISAISDRTNAGRRAAASAVLEGVGEIALSLIEKHLQNSDQPTRIMLAGIVGSVGGEEATRVLTDLTQDEDTNIVASAVAALGRTRSREATALLLDYLRSDVEWLRFTAISALGELGDTRSVDALESYLADPMMQEAVATALSEIGGFQSLEALARHLLSPQTGSIRPAILASIVSLIDEERAVPRMMADAIELEGKQIFKQLFDERILADLLNLIVSSDPRRSNACVTALGWAGDPRAIAVVGLSLSNPATSKAAQRALTNLCENPRTLQMMLEVDPVVVPRTSLANALSNVYGLHTIEAISRLCNETTDPDIIRASSIVFANNREWLRNSVEDLDPKALIGTARLLQGIVLDRKEQAVLEVAATLGTIASVAPQSITFDLEELIPDQATEISKLGRLILFDNANMEKAIEEAEISQKHQSARVRIQAIDILSRKGKTEDLPRLVLHLMDESTGVRRAATRALRRGPSTADVRRAMLVAFSDEDVWVSAEAIITLGTLFRNDEEVLVRLRAALAGPHPIIRVAAAEAISENAEAQDWGMLSALARKDPQPEVRRAAVTAFLRCPEPKIFLSTMRLTLRDPQWSVRRATIECLSTSNERSALRYIVQAAGDEKENPSVRGAALRGLGAKQDCSLLEIASQILGRNESSMVEDAFGSILSLYPQFRNEIDQLSHKSTPRAATILNFILSNN